MVECSPCGGVELCSSRVYTLDAGGGGVIVFVLEEYLRKPISLWAMMGPTALSM